MKEVYLAVLVIFFVLVPLGIVVTSPNRDLHYYKLSTGQVVECNNTGESMCGLNLNRCKDRLEYLCQHNVVDFGAVSK